MTKPVTGLTTFSGSPPPWSLSSLDADIAALQAAINDLGTYANQLSDTSGTPNTITVATAGSLTASYGFGLLLYIKIANTTTSTSVNINLNSLGNVSVVLPSGSAPLVGTFVAGGVYAFIHDGTNFQAVGVGFQSLLSSNNTWTGTNTFDNNVTIGAPASGNALSVTAAANNNAIVAAGSSTSGQSYGLRVIAGTTSADQAIYVTNQANTHSYFVLSGDGSGSLGYGGPIQWSASGNVAMPAPASGITLAVTTVSGGQGIRIFSGGGSPTAFFIDSAFCATGSSTPLFTASNYPGVSANPTTWMRIQINGIGNCWIPVWQ